MPALRGELYYGWLTVDSCQEDTGAGLRGTGRVQHPLLTGAMDILHGATSSPALGVGNFWDTLDPPSCVSSQQAQDPVCQCFRSTIQSLLS